MYEVCGDSTREYVSLIKSFLLGDSEYSLVEIELTLADAHHNDVVSSKVYTALTNMLYELH